jgi:hypothetical protein
MITTRTMLAPLPSHRRHVATFPVIKMTCSKVKATERTPLLYGAVNVGTFA